MKSLRFPPGKYCEIYGFTVRNRVVEYFLENLGTEIAVGDMAKEIGISRPKAYQIIDELMRRNYVLKDRIIGKTQLYQLNKDNLIVKIFMRNFNECLNIIVEEHSKKKTSNSSARIAVSAKGI
ncbi:TPA: hypothetical protein HA235_02980 [Candidatus Woesearchaeota archaeon]|nr:hypothetical protein [Candidatus Woesearchaeota archaeon]HIH31647.1 hypothetical protein [Candidatus Woesearchaeota archaeon]HIH55424.1 hypothetical protein [Candidatus Woesearchaeota archaeon]HIJ02050.1 hypothetical protein [Candidatus Woesearchaeota archaeon]HIJ14615.1 hypothetical protein [Candidatus Woesearchaeota archaeon]